MTQLTVAVTLAVASCTACAKPTALGADSGVAAAVAVLASAVSSLHDPAPSDSAAPDASRRPSTPSTPPNEAVRLGDVRIDVLPQLRDVPELSRHAEVVRAHFADAKMVSVQRAELAAAAHALLISRETDDAALVLVTDAAGELLWKKERPLAGVVPGARHLALAAGHGGQVLLLFHAASWVGVRAWHPDGSILADHQLLDMPACSGLAAVHWPGVGLIAVASSRAGPRAQLLSLRGTLPWGHEGVGVGSPWRAPPALSVAIQNDGWLLSQQGNGAAGDDRWLVFRYDERALAGWPAPLDLGPGATPEQRLSLRAAADGRVVAGPFSGRATPARRVWITPAGGVQPR
jgi:hypothetical protein